MSNAKVRGNSGQATLSFILLISGLIIEIAVAGTFVTYYFSSSVLGERLSARAFAVANSGIRDAQMRIVRNKDYAGTFSLQLDSDAASVTVTKSTSNGTYLYTVTSLGTAGSRQRKFVASIVANAASGLVQTQSVVEQAIQ